MKEWKREGKTMGTTRKNKAKNEVKIDENSIHNHYQLSGNNLMQKVTTRGKQRNKISTISK